MMIIINYNPHRDTEEPRTWTRPKPKPREEVLLGECGVEGVDVCQCVWGPSYTWGHSVEGQRASRPVQIHSYSGGVRGGEEDVCSTTVVIDRVTIIIMTIKTPGLVVVSKPAVITSPCDSSVCHSYLNNSSPLHLPVTAASQTLSTQHLGPGVKSLWVVRIRLILSNLYHLPVVLRQRETSVGCVWVQCESTGIWRENKTWLGGWRLGRFPVVRSGPVHQPKPVWCDANRLNRHLSWRDKWKSIPDPTCIVLVMSRMTRWWSWCDV